MHDRTHRVSKMFNNMRCDDEIKTAGVQSGKCLRINFVAGLDLAVLEISFQRFTAPNIPITNPNIVRNRKGARSGAHFESVPSQESCCNRLSGALNVVPHVGFAGFHASSLAPSFAVHHWRPKSSLPNSLSSGSQSVMKFTFKRRRLVTTQ